MNMLPDDFKGSDTYRKELVKHFLGISEIQLISYLNFRYTRLSEVEAFEEIYNVCGRKSDEHANDLNEGEIKREFVKKRVSDYIDKWYWFELDLNILESDLQIQVDLLKAQLQVSGSDLKVYLSLKYPQERIRQQPYLLLNDCAKVEKLKCKYPEIADANFRWQHEQIKSILRGNH